jgi:hypothetical protein
MKADSSKFGKDSVTFQSAIQRHKDQDTKICNFAWCFVYVRGLVSRLKEGDHSQDSGLDGLH